MWLKFVQWLKNWRERYKCNRAMRWYKKNGGHIVDEVWNDDLFG